MRCSLSVRIRVELVGKQNKIISIRPYDKEQTEGAREFLIMFQEPVDQVINEQSGFGNREPHMDS